MKPIKLPFGLNKDNVLVHITDVESGKKCSCVCPSCRSLLIASKGIKKQPHFKHAVDHECEGGMESAIHLAAKKMIIEKKQITLPKYDLKVSAKDSRGKEHSESKTVVEEGKVICFDFVEEEVELHGMKADILAKKSNKPIIIEIFYLHRVDGQKRAKIVKANISAIEINLSDLTAEDVKDWETFWQFINNPARVQWLNNAKACPAAYPELEKQLKIRIQEQEDKYKDEQELIIREILRIQDIFKALRSEVNIAYLRQEAEFSPIRNYFSDLPFSWDYLPDFVDADIPNGDWIFGCDRRIWQIAFYRAFIWHNKGSFFVWQVYNYIDGTYTKIPRSLKAMDDLLRDYPQLIPRDVYDILPSPWGTLQAYFNYLCKLGMLEVFSNEYELDDPRSCKFRIVNKYPSNLVTTVGHVPT